MGTLGALIESQSLEERRIIWAEIRELFWRIVERKTDVANSGPKNCVSIMVHSRVPGF